MNALFELLGKTYSKEKFDSIVKMGTNFDDYTIDTKKGGVCGDRVSVCPKWQSRAVKEWFKRIKFALITYGDNYDDGPFTIKLASVRTEEDEKAFFDGLASINYDNGYGRQELFGIIAYNDGTWLDRREYDGSEWWESRCFPKEEDYIK